METVVIYSGADEQSHFKLKEILPIKIIDGQLKLSDVEPCQSFMLHEFDADFVRDWHNPPQPQYVIILQGQLRIQLRDSSFKDFYPGDLFIAEDLTGSGHRTLGMQMGKCLVLNLKEPS